MSDNRGFALLVAIAIIFIPMQIGDLLGLNPAYVLSGAVCWLYSKYLIRGDTK